MPFPSQLYFIWRWRKILGYDVYDLMSRDSSWRELEDVGDDLVFNGPLMFQDEGNL